MKAWHSSIFIILCIFFSGCIGDLFSPSGKDKDDVVCCIDVNDNKICDRDEQVDVTTTASTESTLAPTTTLRVACNKDSECPEDEELIVCSTDKVFKLEISYKCEKPGTPQSECVATTTQQVMDTCTSNEVCYSGVCVEESTLSSMGFETTTTSAGATTTLAPIPSEETTTTVAGSTSTTNIVPTTFGTILIPCSSFLSFGQSTCDARYCGLGECKFNPHANPMLPGTCSCEVTLLTTTTMPHLTFPTTTLFQKVTVPSFVSTTKPPTTTFGYFTSTTFVKVQTTLMPITVTTLMMAPPPLYTP